MAREPLLFYHGGRRWTGVPEVQPPRKKRAEHGPGIYLTTKYDTAVSYAKGGGHVQRVELDPTLTWLDWSQTLPLDGVLSWVRMVPRMQNKSALLNDIERFAPRYPKGFPLLALLNLMVANDSLTGKPGLELVRLLVSNGVDAALSEMSGEDWVVVFNPARVLHHRTVPAKGFTGPYDFPRIVK